MKEYEDNLKDKIKLNKAVDQNITEILNILESFEKSKIIHN